MKRYKRSLIIVMLFILVSGTMMISYADSSPDAAKNAMQSSTENADASYTKYENVYAKLGSDGSASDAFVVNHFSIKSPGNITDYGTYCDVKNLTTVDSLSYNNNHVNFFAKKEGEFYYQGRIKKVRLPWDFIISYKLNRKNIAGGDLAGKTGALEITFKSKKNNSVSGSFYDNYLLQTALTLDCKKAENIIAEGAVISDAGADRQLTFTTLPGTDADFTIKTDINDFSMSGFSINAIPYSMNINMDALDTNDFETQISTLTKAADNLDTGASRLKSGLESLCKSNAKLSKGSNQLNNGLVQLSKTSSSIISASSQINSALSSIVLQLNDTSSSNLTHNSEGLNSLAETLNGIQQELIALNTAFEKAQADLARVIQKKTDVPTAEELKALQDCAKENEYAASAYKKLLSSYEQLQTIQKSYESADIEFSKVSDALSDRSSTSITGSIKKISAAICSISDSSSETSSAGISKQTEMLKAGLSELSAQYDTFHNGLSAYADGLTDISKNFGTFQNGITSYLNGTAKLKNGASALSDGMGKFADGIGDMPENINSAIDKLTSDFAGNTSRTLSFTDSRNPDPTSVQFMISTEDIACSQPNKTIEPVEKQGFWYKLKALFTKQ